MAAQTARPPRKVSLMQVYKLAHLLIDLLELEWGRPIRGKASALIEKLVDQAAANPDPADVQAEGMAF